MATPHAVLNSPQSCGFPVSTSVVREGRRRFLDPRHKKNVRGNFLRVEPLDLLAALVLDRGSGVVRGSVRSRESWRVCHYIVRSFPDDVREGRDDEWGEGNF
ncbi:hypothetical protein [Haladaptatus litoreus]|uniref:hypothetical protein n=1 Tax=Haladaptatus litoreus TaxID=553468 RepID=UPI0011159F12|nr:hypothetical protein [Haladaptatus litoreus]